MESPRNGIGLDAAESSFAAAHLSLSLIQPDNSNPDNSAADWNASFSASPSRILIRVELLLVEPFGGLPRLVVLILQLYSQNAPNARTVLACAYNVRTITGEREKPRQVLVTPAGAESQTGCYARVRASQPHSKRTAPTREGFSPCSAHFVSPLRAASGRIATALSATAVTPAKRRSRTRLLSP